MIIQNALQRKKDEEEYHIKRARNNSKTRGYSRTYTNEPMPTTAVKSNHSANDAGEPFHPTTSQNYSTIQPRHRPPQEDRTVWGDPTLPRLEAKIKDIGENFPGQHQHQKHFGRTQGVHQRANRHASPQDHSPVPFGGKLTTVDAEALRRIEQELDELDRRLRVKQNTGPFL